MKKIGLFLSLFLAFLALGNAKNQIKSTAANLEFIQDKKPLQSPTPTCMNRKENVVLIQDNNTPPPNGSQPPPPKNEENQGKSIQETKNSPPKGTQENPLKYDSNNANQDFLAPSGY